MPTSNSAKKRMRNSAKLNRKNNIIRSKIKSLRKDLDNFIEKKDLSKAKDLFKLYCSVLDKAVNKGILKKNTAARRKSVIQLKLTEK
jgi:small subunit ribosomal protein S20